MDSSPCLFTREQENRLEALRERAAATERTARIGKSPRGDADHRSQSPHTMYEGSSRSTTPNINLNLLATRTPRPFDTPRRRAISSFPSFPPSPSSSSHLIPLSREEEEELRTLEAAYDVFIAAGLARMRELSETSINLRGSPSAASNLGLRGAYHRLSGLLLRPFNRWSKSTQQSPGNAAPTTTTVNASSSSCGWRCIRWLMMLIMTGEWRQRLYSRSTLTRLALVAVSLLILGFLVYSTRKLNNTFDITSTAPPHDNSTSTAPVAAGLRARYSAQRY